MDSPIINTISLCAGVGMLDEAFRLGCEHLGWRTKPALYCEWDSYASACLLPRMEEQSLEPGPIWCGDLRDLDCRPFCGSVDAVIAGLPCQPYSLAGKQRGNDDERSHGEDGDGPIPNFLRIVEECQPSLVFLENVPPWVRGGWFRPVGEKLCRLGFTLTQPLFVTAESTGASHRRERVFELAYRNIIGHWQCTDRGESFAWPNRKHNTRRGGANSVANARRSGVRSRDVTGDVESKLPPAERSGSAVFAPGPGADWASIPEHLWPAIEPGFRVLVDGVELVLDQSRTDQLRCGGNGVVALAAAVAFVELMRRIRER